MIFSVLGRTVRGYWYLWLAAWVLLLLVTRYYAPAWDKVAEDRDFEFLPTSAPSRQAEKLFKQAFHFPDDKIESNIVLVLHRSDSSPGALKEDSDFIQNVIEPRLREIVKQEGGFAGQAVPTSEDELFATDNPQAPAPKTSIIARIDTPNAPIKGDLLVSPDHKALLVVIGLTTEFMVKDNWPIIERIEKVIHELQEQGGGFGTDDTPGAVDKTKWYKLPTGTELTLTGSAVIGRDHTEAELQSAKATTWLTVILVVVLLVLIYRAPLLALIPLATVFISVELAFNVLGLLSTLEPITIFPGYAPIKIIIFRGMEIYITILAYGAGIDYCLFLTSRYKEELDRGTPPAEAIGRAVGDVGAALSASAATVICGIAMMAFAQFGKFHQAGLAIPIVLVLVLCATLTFSPALLRLAGRWAFWRPPLLWLLRKLAVVLRLEGPRAFWSRRSTKSNPAATSSETPNANGFVFGELGLFWERVGAMLQRRPGRIWLATIVLMAPFAIFAGLQYNFLSYDLIGDLPSTSPSVAGTQVLVKHFAPGIVGTTTVVLENEHVDFRKLEDENIIGRSAAQKRRLGLQAIEGITNYLSAHRADLGVYDVRSYTAPLGVTAQARKNITDDERDTIEGLVHYNNKNENDINKSDARVFTRFNIVLNDNPFSEAGFNDLNRIEQAIRTHLPENMPQDSTLAIVGTTASVRDLSSVMKTDRTRIEILVLCSVFLILIVLLCGPLFVRGLIVLCSGLLRRRELNQVFSQVYRIAIELLSRFIVTIYLLLSVLFSYYVTLGVTIALFWALDPHGFTGIDWKVAIFLFTILIAVGEDYNIFLITRIHEEERQYSPVQAITHALTRTGPIISSCGLIMAGTFGSLLAGSLNEMKQLGFALTFGVLLDTFIVRPILVPSFLVLLRSGRFSPTRWFHHGPAAPPSPDEKQSVKPPVEEPAG